MRDLRWRSWRDQTGSCVASSAGKHIKIEMLERVQDPGMAPGVAHGVTHRDDRDQKRHDRQLANPASVLAGLDSLGKEQEPERNQPEQPAQALRRAAVVLGLGFPG